MAGLAVVKESAKVGSFFIDSLYRLGLCYLSLRQEESVVSCFQEVLSVGPYHEEAQEMIEQTDSSNQEEGNIRGPRLFGLFVVFVALLLVAPLLLADEAGTLTLEVAGKAPIHNQDVVTAEKAALEDACVAAVREAMETLVTAKNYTRNFVSINDSILTQPGDFIKACETLATNVTEDTVTVPARVTVSLSPLQSNLESLLGSMDKPRFALLSESSFAKETLERELEGRGFTVLFCAQECKGVITPEWASKRGESCSADVLVLVEADVEYAMFMLPGEKPQVLKGGDIWGCIATLSVSSFWLDTAERLAGGSICTNGSGMSKEAAFRQAVGRASPKLIDAYVEKISRAWSNLLLNGRSLDLSVSGVSYTDLMELRQRLGQIFGVKDIIQREFESGRALLEVYFTGSSQTLADLIAITKFPNMETVTTEVRRGGINLMVRSG